MGKGGSGKTTLSAAFAAWRAAKSEREVVVFDADVNSHLQETLGISGEPVQIGHKGEEIAEYVRGTRRDIGNAPLLSTTPPARESRFITCSANDPLLARYAIRKNNLSLISVGSFKSSDVGANCYHTKLHSLCMILNHLLDKGDDLVVVDATAGTDTLSTALLIAYDLNVFVVEPTAKSIGVYLDYVGTDPESIDKTVVLINKVMDPADEAYVRTQIEVDKIIGAIPYSPAMRRFEQGEMEALTDFIAANEHMMELIFSRLANSGRDWVAYLRRLEEIHKKNCEWWYNDFYGASLHTGLDSEFSYEKVRVTT
jgi:CO dehydrogenase maturation factor